jgi:RNA polymerase sigma-70 factor (ECF subfamily)
VPTNSPRPPTTAATAGTSPLPAACRTGDLTESVLVSLARDGDETAFEELVRRHQHHQFAIALRMISQYQDAEDIVQDAFFHAWRSLPTFRGEAGFGTWLTRIVLNQCHSRSRRPRLVSLPSEEPISPAPDIEQVALVRRQHEMVQRALLELPYDQRAALVLHVFAGHPYREVARVMNITENTAKVRVHRARKTLTDRLREWND